MDLDHIGNKRGNKRPLTETEEKKSSEVDEKDIPTRGGDTNKDLAQQLNDEVQRKTFTTTLASTVVEAVTNVLNATKHDETQNSLVSIQKRLTTDERDLLWVQKGQEEKERKMKKELKAKLRKKFEEEHKVDARKQKEWKTQTDKDWTERSRLAETATETTYNRGRLEGRRSRSRSRERKARYEDQRHGHRGTYSHSRSRSPDNGQNKYSIHRGADRRQSSEHHDERRDRREETRRGESRRGEEHHDERRDRQEETRRGESRRGEETREEHHDEKRDRQEETRRGETRRVEETREEYHDESRHRREETRRGESRREEETREHSRAQDSTNTYEQNYNNWGPDQVVQLLRKHHFSDAIQQGFLNNHISGADLGNLSDEQLLAFGMLYHNIQKFKLVLTEMRATKPQWWR
jgi:hypothetical protein